MIVTVLAPVLIVLTAVSALAFWKTTGAGTGSATAASSWTENTGTSVASVSPSSRGQNSALTTVTITGSGFATGSWTANFGAGITVGTVSRTSATTITAQVTVTGAAATGARNVSVTQGTTYTCSNCFTVTAAPTITSPTTASPKSIPNGTASTFDVLGTGFVSGATVAVATNTGDFTLGTVTFVNSTKITITVTAQSGNGHKGTGNLTVTNPDGGSVTQTAALINS